LGTTLKNQNSIEKEI